MGETMQGYPNDIRGNGHRRTRNDVRALAKAKQLEGIEKKERHDKRAALIFTQRFLLYCAVGYLTSAPMIVYTLPSRRMRI